MVTLARIRHAEPDDDRLHDPFGGAVDARRSEMLPDFECKLEFRPPILSRKLHVLVESAALIRIRAEYPRSASIRLQARQADAYSRSVRPVCRAQ